MAHLSRCVQPALSGNSPIVLACSRRQFLSQTVLLSSSAGAILSNPKPAQAGLLLFPANNLNNNYYLVRAGESEEDGAGATLTNPVWKTSMRSGLSDTGKRQVVKQVVPELARLGACEDGCWIWPSITQNSYQTAEIVAYEFDIGRSRIVPEYSFLDARGVGGYEGRPLQEVVLLMSQGDLLDRMWKPPKGTDGTPNESSEEVFARVRQVLSITETQYQGEEVVFIAPDSDTLSILQAAVLGRELTQHRAFAFQPGEVRPLQLATQTFDDSPAKVSCPNPPYCRPT